MKSLFKLSVIFTFLGAFFQIYGQDLEGFTEVVDQYITTSINQLKPAEIQSSNYIFLDAREKEEYEVSHLQNAYWIGYNDFNKERLNGIDKQSKIVVYCAIGARSNDIAVELIALGYQDVSNLYGGIFSWANQGYDLYHGEDLTNKVHPYDQNWSKWLNKEVVEISEVGVQTSDFISVMKEAWVGYFNWAMTEFTFSAQPWYHNYFLWLILLSLIVWGMEVKFPWRENQRVFRKDFWQDAIYMFLNFYVFAFFLQGFFRLVGFTLDTIGVPLNDLAFLNLSSLPKGVALLIFFVLNDFVQWFTHVLLHRYNFLWNFHKVHHSVKEMGFAAHLRYHWMENVLYKPLKTLVVMILIGGEPQDAFLVHYFAIAIGHLNHANLNLDYGFFKYILNNPKMHIWHHVKHLPEGHPHGVNFGISLSIWDYLFKTAVIPYEGKDIELGFENDDKFPKTILGQSIYPLNRKD
ncbi:MAG: sterol desaturase family protein [Flavobacteriales bacterium]|nr:sterol desaturase family protein [Flavobacteriales bacterium]